MLPMPMQPLRGTSTHLFLRLPLLLGALAAGPREMLFQLVQEAFHVLALRDLELSLLDGVVAVCGGRWGRK